MKKIALSTKQLQNNTEKHIPIPLYDGIYGKSLDQLLKNGAFIILYLWKKRYGHWCVVTRHNNGKDVEFFDPYDKPPDYWLSKNSYEKNKELGQEKPYLLNKIMKNNKYDHIYYNPVAFQDNSNPEDVRTCGRHVLTRMRNRDILLLLLPSLEFGRVYTVLERCSATTQDSYHGWRGLLFVPVNSAPSFIVRSNTVVEQYSTLEFIT